MTKGRRKATATGNESTAKPPADAPNPAHLSVIGEQGDMQDRSLARTILRPSVTGGLALHRIRRRDLGDCSSLTLDGLVAELSHQCTQVSKGDMARPEAMLTAQAHTLDSLFSDLTRLAYGNFSNFDVAERLFRLAFRAQGLARATVETIGVLKNPPMVFAKQANVTTGPQQVNNGVPRTREPDQIVQNELLEQTNAQRLEHGTPSVTGGQDQELVSVGSINRAANS